jgi:hypothetical protein
MQLMSGQLKTMQLARRFFFLLFFPTAALAQTTFSCPANQYVSTQLVNTGQSCSPLPTFPVSAVVVGTNSSGQVVAVPSQTVATVFAAPSGAAGVPTFRGLVASDIPVLNQNTTGTAASVTGVIAAAQLPLATSSAVGGVKCDGTTITCTGGVIAAVGGGGGSAIGTLYPLRANAVTIASSSSTYWIGATGVPTTINQSSYYFTVLKGGTLKSVEYATSQSAFLAASCTFQIYDLTTSTVLAGTATTNTINSGNTPVTFSVTGLSDTVSAGDKLQVQILTPAGLTSSVWQFNADIYIE